ncbi:MAG: MFS transporter, partial [Firmicutes bacterium]|nr:MFS transporter [Bacillota bacterium]
HKGKVVALCSAIAVVGMIIQFVAQQNATVFLVGAFVQQFGTYSALTTIMSMMADCVELSLLNEGVRMDGFFSAFGYFWHKLGIALGSAATGWILGIMHYVPNAAEQAASVYTGINIMFFYIPTVLFVIMALAFLAYPISNKKFEEIVAQIAEKYGN